MSPPPTSPVDLAHAADQVRAFLNPRSVAVVGASPQRSGIRGLLLHLLTRNGFEGAVYPVNPSHSEIGGRPCYPNLQAIGASVDLAVIAVPAPAVLAALEDAAAARTRNVVIISSGFAEEGPLQAELQDQIAALARRAGMRVCGPNGQGFFNLAAGVAATFSPSADPEAHRGPPPAVRRRLAVVSQSGGLGFAFLDRGRAIGLDFSHVVSTGNECDLSLADFLAFLAGDDDTDAVLLYVEQVRDLALFQAAAREAAARGKPVILLKVGRSEPGARAALAHTASRAGQDPADLGAFTDLGVRVVEDPDEAIAVAAAVLSHPPVAGPRVAVVTSAGGAGTLLSDRLAGAGLTLPVLSTEIQAQIRPLLPSYASAANPVDVTAQGIATGGLVKALEVLMAGDEVDAIVLAHAMGSETRVSLDLEALQGFVASGRKPILVYSYTLPSALARRSLAEAGVVLFSSVRELTTAVATLAPRA